MILISLPSLHALTACIPCTESLSLASYYHIGHGLTNDMLTLQQMRDSRGKRVGRCKEWVKVVGDTEVDVRVLAMRHKDKGYIPPERQALKPERVLAYRYCASLTSPDYVLYAVLVCSCSS